MNRSSTVLATSATLLFGAALAGCSRSAPPPAAANPAGAAAAASYEPGIGTPPLSDAQAAQLRRQIMDDAAHTAQQLGSHSARDSAQFSAEENARISAESCGALAPDQQLACRTQAESDLEAARAQARARHQP